MEKRLLIAALLSFIVVYFWSSTINRKQPPPLLSLNETKNENITQGSEPLQKVQTSVSKEKISEEKVKTEETLSAFENNKILVQFSNLGGVIKDIQLKEYKESLPPQKILAVKGFENVVFKLETQTKNEISYVFETEKLKIYKNYFLSQDDYIVKASIRMENKTQMSKQINLDISPYSLDMSKMDIKNSKKSRNTARSRSLLEYVVSVDKKEYRKNNAYKFKSKELKKADGLVDWVGFRNRYFCTIIKPLYETSGYIIDPIREDALNIEVLSKEIEIPATSYQDFDYIIFSGPEKIPLLKTYNFGFEQIKMYYKNGLLNGMAKLMNTILHLLHRIVPNWGVCILLMSVLVYFSMYPLTIRSMQSMKKMQSLQPEIVKIKEKYKNDQQKANMEVMELYKKYKVNPLGGCLPMFLQMPVFIGLYQVLWRSVYFNGAAFLWIKDLSQPDRLAKLPFTLPLVNSSDFNLLPVLMMIIMFFQQKLSAKNMVLSDPAQKTQQKMMSTIMPVFLGFIFYTFASGLTLYFTMFYLFSSFTQWKMSQQRKVK